jgi:GT2 family glycosyltransferase
LSAAPLPITVLIPAYNREQLLEAAIASVKAQTRPPAELLVVDDCSTDGTAAVAERLGATVLRHERNQGAAAARNSGLAAATQEWVALLDSDDAWLPWHLETVWEHRDSHVLVAGSSLQVGDGGRPLAVSGPVVWRDRTLTAPAELVFPENFVPASGAMVRRATVNEVGGYDTGLRYSEDFDLWLRLLQKGTAVCLARVTVVYRLHEGQKSRHRGDAGRAQRLIAQRALGHGSRAPLERRVGVRAWDDGREALRVGEPAAAVRAFTAIARHPQRIAGVLATWGRRRLIRRRARALTSDGLERVALLAGPEPDAPRGEREGVRDRDARGARLEDWRRRPALDRLRALILAPPRRTVSPRRRDAWLSRALGIEHRRP